MPKIVWQDKENVGPINIQEAKDSAKLTFRFNGAVRIINSFNVRIEGIAISGGGNFPFGYEFVWEETGGKAWTLQHGNAAMSIFESGRVNIRFCEISDAYLGIYLFDGNKSGIYAYSQPADTQSWKREYISGSGNFGDHLLEYNRIHDNSFGFFSEGAWDLGSVIRYNLFYENHHPKSMAKSIRNLTSEGLNLPGGAMAFKDHIISPLAIYNNTFWKNTISFVGLFRCGGHYLIFNNIVAEPYLDPEYGSVFTFLDPYFSNRMFHCVYAAHVQPMNKQVMTIQVTDPVTKKTIVEQVTLYLPRIMNNFGDVEATDLIVPIELSDGSIIHDTLKNATLPGNRVIIKNPKSGGYSASNNIRWLETKFKSTDPADSKFLVPDWNDSLVNRYIVNQGYPATGVLDPDGSPADLGAIPKSGQHQKMLPTIRPAQPVLINGTTASASFYLTGSIVEPKITYARWINELPSRADGGSSYGGSSIIMPQSNIIEISNLPQVTEGLNTFTFTVPARAETNEFGFLELIIGGKSANNTAIFSVGFLPYRKGVEGQSTATGYPVQKKSMTQINMKLQRKTLVSYFSGNTSTDKFTLELFDVRGRRVALFAGNSGSSRQHNLDKLSSGVYYAQLNCRGVVSKTTVRLVR